MKLAIWIKPECPYCQQTIKLIKAKHIPAKLYNVNKLGGTESVVRALKHWKFIKSSLSVKTVPIIISIEPKVKYIGGYDTIARLLLQTMP